MNPAVIEILSINLRSFFKTEKVSEIFSSLITSAGVEFFATLGSELLELNSSYQT